jgi:outer membrane protein assembly factor BamB
MTNEARKNDEIRILFTGSSMNRRTLALFVLGLVPLIGFTQAADWPGFRGPGGLGVAPDKNLPITWNATKNVLWKTALPGPGASSPIVVGKKVFVTCYKGYGDGSDGAMNDLKLILVCLDRAGKILWQREVAAELPEEPYRSYLANHGYASSTPVSDGERVCVFFGKTGVFAYDLEGKQLWRQSVGEGKHAWGSGTSPLLYKDLVIVNAGVESGSLVALNKKNGSRVWQAKGMEHSWNTPLLVSVPEKTQAGGKQEMVVSVYDQILGFDPEKGTLLWKCAGIEDYVCPSIVAHDGVVFAIGARENTAMAIRAGGSGDVSGTRVLWKIRKGSNVSSPVYHEGHLYWASDNRGIVYCVQADSGKVVYEEKLAPDPERIYASPVAADGKLYFVSRTQGTYVLDAQPRLRLLAHNLLDDASVFNASPAVDGGQMLLRSDRYLYCLGAK